MVKSTKNIKPTIKKFLSIEQTVQFLNSYDSISYSITDLYEEVVDEKITPVFLVDNVDVGYLFNNDSDNHVEWFKFSGYCQIDAERFKYLYTSNQVLLVDDLIIYKPIKPQFVPNSTEIELTKNTSLKFQPIEKTIFDDSQEQVRGLPTGDYINHYAVHLKDIRFPVIELEQLISNGSAYPQDDLTDKTKQTYLILIGALHYLLNKKKGNKDAPYSTKDSLVLDITGIDFETTGLKRSNVSDILKKADDVYKDLKKNDE